jgi:ferredoxin
MPLQFIKMIKLTIDHITIEAQEGMTIMEAAASAGIVIPSMCFRPGYANHPSCMVCLVKDTVHNHLVPSCAMPVSEGMNILTNTEDVLEARKEALELLLSDHVGDCEAPCRISCPAFMDIPLMNRLIAAGDFDQAIRVVREEIALPLVLGYICPAPCEKACKRKPMDAAVSICLLKRAAAQHENREQPGFSGDAGSNGKKVAIIGTGSAGLAAAFYLQRSGHHCVLFDRNEQAGGAIRYSIPDERLPKKILDAEIETIAKMGARYRMNTTITREIFQNEILPGFDAVILATGHSESGLDGLFGIQPDKDGTYIHKKSQATSLPGVYTCGNIIREQKMAVHSVAQGKMAAMQVEVYLGRHTGKERLPASSIQYPASRIPARSSVSITGHLCEPEWPEYLQESNPDHRIEPGSGRLTGYTREEAIREAKRCLRCDCRKPESCKLRQYAEEYGANRKRFAGPDRKHITRSMQHEEVVYETEKCIRCGLCVEITGKYDETTGLSFAGRGFDVRISVPFNETIREALTTAARECVEACPTGALAFKKNEERNNG